MFTTRKNNLRLKQFDYTTNGYYFITNNTNYNQPFLHGAVKSTIRNELETLEKNIQGAKTYYYSIMPTHIHVIIELSKCKESIPEIWRKFKSKTTVKVKQNGFTYPKLWQPNYYEHIIRNEFALRKVIEYICNNPFKENLPLQEIYGDRIPEKRI